jgi:DNA-binding MarR family transcriptional regulator
MRRVDERLEVGYQLTGKSAYSPTLVRHLEELETRGLVRIVRLAHDAFMPKTFLLLTVGGRREANKAQSEMEPEAAAVVSEIAEHAREEAASQWRIFARP